MPAPLHAYPLALQPVYKSYIWGGDRLAEAYGRQVPESPCAESWEVADRPDGSGVILNGTYRGMRFGDWIGLHGTAATGTRHPGPRFPLLVKLIDANADLSVQVHPNEATAAAYGGDPKTEMWYLLDCTPGAQLYAGMQPGTTRARFMDALARKRLADDILATVPARLGQVIFMPGGRVHAIGAGCLILEVQQNSNTTYRVYDWDRTDTDGNPRDLHLDEALRVVDWAHAEPDVREPGPVRPATPPAWQALLETRWFSMWRTMIDAPIALDPDPETFRILFVEAGRVTVSGGGIDLPLATGSTCLLPAALTDAAITPAADTPATVIRIEA